MNMKPTWLNLLLNKRMLLVLALGFVSGLPLGLNGTLLQAWYAIDGVDVVTTFEPLALSPLKNF
ncbi:MAG: hypothetical protein JSS07_10210 [Proteobacteria bacterium]|nr:hypothetical protein [Pseudomonadota bacterium]